MLLLLSKYLHAASEEAKTAVTPAPKPAITFCFPWVRPPAPIVVAIGVLDLGPIFVPKVQSHLKKENKRC